LGLSGYSAWSVTPTLHFPFIHRSMTVSTLFRAQNGTTSHIPDDSHPHGALPSVQAHCVSSSSSTPLPSRPHDAPHISHPYVALHSVPPCASSAPPPTLSTLRSNIDVSDMALPLHPTATSSRFHDASHEPHLCITPHSIRSRTPLAPSPTLPISHSKPHISSTPLIARPHASTHVAHSHVASRPEQANFSFNSPYTPPPLHSMEHPTAAGLLPPRRKCLHRCFVCGKTGKHCLNLFFAHGPTSSFPSTWPHLTPISASFCSTVHHFR
jgi:hypothetical protein